MVCMFLKYSYAKLRSTSPGAHLDYTKTLTQRKYRQTVTLSVQDVAQPPFTPPPPNRLSTALSGEA